MHLKWVFLLLKPRSNFAAQINRYDQEACVCFQSAMLGHLAILGKRIEVPNQFIRSIRRVAAIKPSPVRLTN